MRNVKNKSLKIALMTTLSSLVLIMNGCGSDPTQSNEIENLRKRNAELEQQIEALQEENASLHAQLPAQTITEKDELIAGADTPASTESTEEISITEDNFYDYFRVEELFRTEYNGFDEPERYYYILRVVPKEEYVSRITNCNITAEYEYKAYSNWTYSVDEKGELIKGDSHSSTEFTETVVNEFTHNLFDNDKPPFYLIICAPLFGVHDETVPYMVEDYSLKRVKGTLELLPEETIQDSQENDAAGIRLVCKGSSVNVRSEPSTSSSVVGTIESGDTFIPSETVQGKDKQTWYQITLKNGVVGYVRKDFFE